MLWLWLFDYTDHNLAPHEMVSVSLEEISNCQLSGADGAPSPSRAYTSEEYLKITEEQLKAAAAQNQGQTSTPVESQLEPQTPSQG